MKARYDEIYYNDPDSNRLLTRYAAARRSGHSGHAVKILSILNKRMPGNGRLAFMMGRTLLAAGRLAEADPWLEKGRTYHLRAKRADDREGGPEKPTSLCLIGLPRSASSNLSVILAKATNRNTIEFGFGLVAPILEIFLQ